MKISHENFVILQKLGWSYIEEQYIKARNTKLVPQDYSHGEDMKSTK